MAHGKKSVDQNKTSVGFLPNNQISMKEALDINAQTMLAEEKHEHAQLQNEQRLRDSKINFKSYSHNNASRLRAAEIQRQYQKFWDVKINSEPIAPAKSSQ